MEIEKDIVLKSKNLNLRIPTLEDIDHVFSATRYEGFNDGMLWNAPANKAELIKPFKNGIKWWEKGEGYGFTIEDNKNYNFLGRISIRKTKIQDRWNIGFWTHPKHQRKGIMTEAVALIMKFAFETLNAHSIEADYAVWNKGSEKVLLSNGFSFVDYKEKGYQKNGKWEAENIMRIDRERWMIAAEK